MPCRLQVKLVCFQSIQPITRGTVFSGAILVLILIFLFGVVLDTRPIQLLYRRFVRVRVSVPCVLRAGFGPASNMHPDTILCSVTLLLLMFTR